MPEKVILVHVSLHDREHVSAEVAELDVLARSAGAEIIGVVTAKRRVPDSRLFVGLGKAEAIKQLVSNADLVIFNHNLSPSQERNLERFLQCRVLDRTALVLDIFAKRARTFEGKLQVELAQLQHLATRLVRGWTHLERQRGGIGLRGPGETQLETDRRVLRKKIVTLKEELAKVRKQRLQGRKARTKAQLATVALVGYTNAGKSSLFNRLTAAGVYVADKLFATLDPTLRSINVPHVGPVILADTVGFIRQLPHELVAAFKATLEETQNAEVLLHVVDASDPEHLEKIAVVNAVLQEINADKIPQILVYNKIDLLPEAKERLDYDQVTHTWRVWLSATTGGFDNLIYALQQVLASDLEEIELCLLGQAGKVRAQLYKIGAITAEKIDEQGNYHLKVYMRRNDLKKFLR